MSIGPRLRSIISNVSVRISAGPNKGLKWSRVTGKRYRDGTFEAQRVVAIERFIQPGDCFWDIGAHRGYITLVAARRVGPTGQVFAFEPHPYNVPYLCKHVRWNVLSNTRVFPVAVGCADGRRSFGGGKSLTSHLGEGRYTVNVRSVQSLIASGECNRPTFMKVDVEGAELEVLVGAAAQLLDPRIAVLVATHTSDLHDQCLRALSQSGCRIVESGKVAEARALGWHAVEDPEILAIGPQRRVSEADIEFFRSNC